MDTLIGNLFSDSRGIRPHGCLRDVVACWKEWKAVLPIELHTFEYFHIIHIQSRSSAITAQSYDWFLIALDWVSMSKTLGIYDFLWAKLQATSSNRYLDMKWLIPGEGRTHGGVSACVCNCRRRPLFPACVTLEDGTTPWSVSSYVTPEEGGLHCGVSAWACVTVVGTPHWDDLDCDVLTWQCDCLWLKAKMIHAVIKEFFCLVIHLIIIWSLFSLSC